MKKLLNRLLLLSFTSVIHAQAPEKLSYQAVIRNSLDELVVNQEIGIKISILKGCITASPTYVELHNPNTNANGLITIEIGGGNVQMGNFTNIDWSGDIFYLKTEVDPSGGENYTITGVSQFLSVPYALHAKTAGEVPGMITEYQTLSREGNVVTLSNEGGSFTDSVNVYTAGQGIEINDNVISTNAGLSAWTQVENNISYNGGNIGVGTSEPKAKVQVKQGDVYLESIGRGVIMKSPSGQCWRLTIDNVGRTQTEAIDCPESN